MSGLMGGDAQYGYYPDPNSDRVAYGSYEDAYPSEHEAREPLAAPEPTGTSSGGEGGAEATDRAQADRDAREGGTGGAIGGSVGGDAAGPDPSSQSPLRRRTTLTPDEAMLAYAGTSLLTPPNPRRK